MENKAFQHLYILNDLDLYQSDRYKQSLYVVQLEDGTLLSEVKRGIFTPLEALLASSIPLEVNPDIHIWTTQMVESNYYSQSRMISPSKKVIKTLIAYANNEEDPKRRYDNERYRKRIRKILGAVSTQICKLDDTWHEVAVEDDWAYGDHLETSRLILLLVDDNFVNTQYCFCPKLTQAICRHRSRTAHVIPIYLRPCLLEGVPFARLPFFPSKPVSQYKNNDSAFEIITQIITTAAKDIRDRIL